ncbi:MAG TPA: hypothetical protein DCM28_02545 [Phycisphaerales bacterium]|nr:hypothetical protein [Phycisphaerales bacterium]|tara:strand:+ start:2046 stop:2420 length:375 start_codon:yes stop_codon:yes gene_type:complete
MKKSNIDCLKHTHKSYVASKTSLKTKATENGRYWAQHIAQPFHLERLYNWYHYESLRGQPPAPCCWLDLLFLAISDLGEEHDPKAWEFFKIPIQNVNDPDYIEDYILGAISFWESDRDSETQKS